jgi:hypothetical protein
MKEKEKSMFRRFLGILVCVGVLATLMTSAKAEAVSVLTLTDTFGGTNTVWALSVTTGCTACTVSLTANFQDPDGAGAGVNAYTGQYVDAVQWVISQPDADPAAVSMTATTAGTTADWSTNLDQNLSANQCGGGASNAICNEWITASTGEGFGPIVNGSTLTWTYGATFAAALPTSLTEGNIRAAFNTLNPNNGNVQNFNIFSPDGGSFTNNGGVSPVPEPSTVLLLGSGLIALGLADWKKRQAKK